MTSSLLALAPSALAAADAPAIPAGRLVPAALIGIALIVLLITRFKLHPFLGLTLGSLAVGRGRRRADDRRHRQLHQGLRQHGRRASAS